MKWFLSYIGKVLVCVFIIALLMYMSVVKFDDEDYFFGEGNPYFDFLFIYTIFIASFGFFGTLIGEFAYRLLPGRGFSICKSLGFIFIGVIFGVIIFFIASFLLNVDFSIGFDMLISNMLFYVIAAALASLVFYLIRVFVEKIVP